MRQEDLTFFDPSVDFSVTERLLPHWAQAGAMCFITCRTADSLPGSVLSRLDDEIAAVLRAEKQQRDLAGRARTHRRLFAARDKYLDAGYGRCLLANPQYAATVLKSLRHFDEDRYFLTDVVVMPNHAHFLVAFPSPQTMLDQCTSWKRFTARQINAAQNERGEFWQVDQFDHLVRSLEEFEYYQEYIKNNPIAAGLNPTQFLHYSKDLNP